MSILQSRLRRRQALFVTLATAIVGTLVWRSWSPPIETFTEGCAIVTSRGSAPRWARDLATRVGYPTDRGPFVDATTAKLVTPKCTDRDLRALNQLEIVAAPITDAGMQEFSNFTFLESLELVNVPLSDKGLETLKQMPRLKKVRLTGVWATDAHLWQLRDVPALELIELYGTRTTQGGHLMLMEAHPNCEFRIKEPR